MNVFGLKVQDGERLNTETHYVKLRDSESKEKTVYVQIIVNGIDGVSE